MANQSEFVIRNVGDAYTLRNGLQFGSMFDSPEYGGMAINL